MGDHVAHYKGLFERGGLQLGGPFTSTPGGMMVPAEGLSLDEMRAFAAADPAVKSGLLTYEIRTWYVAMKKTAP